MVVAGVCGLLAFALVFNQLKDAKKSKYEVVVAKDLISEGTILALEHLALSPPLSGVDPSSFFLVIDDAIGLSVNQEIPKGKAIRREYTQVDGTLYRVDKIPIPTGMRAMTLSTKEIDQIPQYIRTGNYVDVLGYPNNLAETQTTIVHSAQVLSLLKDETNDTVVKSITVAFSPSEAEAASSAIRRGQLRVVLRSEKGDKPHFRTMRDNMEIIRGAEVPRIQLFQPVPAITDPEQMRIGSIFEDQGQAVPIGTDPNSQNPTGGGSY